MLKKLFTFDLGNSHPHVGYFLDGKLESVINWIQFTQNYPSTKLEDSSLVICQVGATPAGLSEYLPHALALPSLTHQKFLHMPVSYSETLGLDRLYCAYHVYEKIQARTLPSRVAMIDAGTFMTLDLINEEGFQGGYILPGLSVFLQCYGKGHQLPTLQGLSSHQEKLPQTTEQAISEAAQLYIKQVVLGFLQRTQPEYIIITGGSGGMIMEHLQDWTCQYEPHWIHWAMKSIASCSHLQASLQSQKESQ